MITSTRNPKIQYIRKLQSQARFRREKAAFVVEGVRLVEEALKSNWDTLLVLHTQGLDKRGKELLRELEGRNTPIVEVNSRIFGTVSDTQTPQGILAVVSLPDISLPEGIDFLLIADSVRDPGNLGTILRTAAAAGVGAVLLASGTVDAFSPKVVRAGMGAHFKIPVLSTDWTEIRKYLSSKGKEDFYKIYLADAGGGQVYTQADFTSPTALIIGGEAQGAGAQAMEIMHERLHIPMPGNAESLNVAIAAAILMFEVVRQREGNQPIP